MSVTNLQNVDLHNDKLGLTEHVSEDKKSMHSVNSRISRSLYVKDTTSNKAKDADDLDTDNLNDTERKRRSLNIEELLDQEKRRMSIRSVLSDTSSFKTAPKYGYVEKEKMFRGIAVLFQIITLIFLCIAVSSPSWLTVKDNSDSDVVFDWGLFRYCTSNVNNLAVNQTTAYNKLIASNVTDWQQLDGCASYGSFSSAPYGTYGATAVFLILAIITCVATLTAAGLGTFVLKQKNLDRVAAFFVLMGTVIIITALLMFPVGYQEGSFDLPGSDKSIRVCPNSS
eukprot:Awhi_evm1s13186